MKQYILLSLAVSSNQQLIEGYYAGDCLDETMFSPEFGGVAFNCQDSCDSIKELWQKGDKWQSYDESNDMGCYSDYYCEEIAILCNNDPVCLGSLFCSFQDIQCFFYFVCYEEDSQNQNNDCFNTLDSCEDIECIQDEICSDTTCDQYVQCEQDTQCTAQILCGTDQTCRAKAEEMGFERRLQQEIEEKYYEYRSAIVLYGIKSLGSNNQYHTYCDHYHLYSFKYENVQVLQQSVDSELSLIVYGYTMVGTTSQQSVDPPTCYFNPNSTQSGALVQAQEVPTTGDQLTSFCGYYTTYEWFGDNDVYFEIFSQNTIRLMAQSFQAFLFILILQVF